MAAETVLREATRRQQEAAVRDNARDAWARCAAHLASHPVVTSVACTVSPPHCLASLQVCG